MIIWGLYLSLFWAITIYSCLNERLQSKSYASIAESLITAMIITLSVFGLFYQHIGMTLAPYLLALIPLSAYFEVTNALHDLKSDTIRKEIAEDIPDDVLTNAAILALSVTLLPGYIAAMIVIVKYGNLIAL